MQELAGLLFPVLLMLFALAMEKFERGAAGAGEPRGAADAGGVDAGDDDGPTVETLATIGLPSAVEQLDLDRALDRDDEPRQHRRAS